MNKKILVEIYVPNLDIKYNIFIPSFKKISNVILDLVKGISELSDGAYPIINRHALMNSDTCEIYNNNLSIKESNIKNGTKLILI
ncbi:MAG: hypothetical protein IKN63_04705 [Bacilli bacterium]|nr:hypothetical protein [Bacilli bacterium]